MRVEAMTTALVAMALAGCATGGPPPGVIGARARQCQVANITWVLAQTVSNPVMTLSSDGWCQRSMARDQNGPLSLVAERNPLHGTLIIDGRNSTTPTYYYVPVVGYVGPDIFAMRTSSNMLVDVKVNVTQ